VDAPLLQRRWRPVAVLAAACVVAAGCDDADKRGAGAPDRVPGTPPPAHAREVARDPYALNCGDLVRQPQAEESQKLVIRAEFALARVPALEKRVAQMTENRVGRSVYWALTAFCEGQPPTLRPAKSAVHAVQQGQFLVQPRADSWTSAEAWWKAHPNDRPKPHPSD
jgi:hypothetical protein